MAQRQEVSQKLAIANMKPFEKQADTTFNCTRLWGPMIGFRRQGTRGKNTEILLQKRKEKNLQA